MTVADIRKKEETVTTFSEAMAYLRSLHRFGVRPGIERMRELLHRLGNPHHTHVPVFHITGTNGKGSVSSMVAMALRAGGYKTGVYTSPALELFRERIQVNGHPIAESAVGPLMDRIKGAGEAMASEGGEPLTAFEVTTALGFLYYAQEGIDALVLEVGMGGRYDATNVIERPWVTAVTNVSWDHMDVLGTTIEEIAWNKAGIIKPAVPCVTAASDEAQGVLRQAAEGVGAALIDARPVVLAQSPSLRGQRVDLRVAGTTYRDLEVSLLGRHQVENAAVALAALEAARRRGLSLTDAAMREGLRSARWPGRFELWTDGLAPIVLDCAHNEASMAALAATVNEYFPGRRAIVVLGMLADKEVGPALRHIVPYMRAAVVTTPQCSRALPADQLAAKLPPGRVGAVEPEPEKAVARARRMMQGGDLLLVTGSCYLVGPVRQMLARDSLTAGPAQT